VIRGWPASLGAVRALLVLPTYDEAENVRRVLREVRLASPETDVLVVDDASPDGTAQIAEDEAAILGQIDLLRRKGKRGLGRAYREGFTWGLQRGYEVLIEMDADLSHDPEDLPRLIATVESGADLAIGSRYVAGGSVRGWAWHRRALSIGGNAYAGMALGIDVRDMTSGFRAYKGDVLSKVPLSEVASDGYGFQIEMVREVLLVGGQVVEVPICFAERTAGRSKMSSRIVAEALWDVTRWALRDRAIRIARAGAKLLKGSERSASRQGD
jgi:dolichol-phosphate mannosyltransferase